MLLLVISIPGYQLREGTTTASSTSAGITLYENGDFDRAIKALREAVKKNKSDSKAWHYLGLAFMVQGDRKKAGEAFLKAEDLQSTAFDKEFYSGADVITEQRLARLTTLLRELIELREKLVEVNSTREPVFRMDLLNARARADCIQQNTKVVDGHPTVKRSDLKITKIQIVKRAEPDFPRRESKPSGPSVTALVIFRVIVGPDGSVNYLELVQSSGDSFTEEAKLAVAGSKFRPASICGRPISSPLQLEYRFFTTP
jgi:tetratricopeptide (TPR) repeat protein